MSAVDTVRVGLDQRSYDILVGPGLVAEAGRRMAPVLSSPRVVVVTDETVARLHLATLRGGLDAAGIRHDTVVLPPGEATKDFPHLQHLCERVLEFGVDRGAALVALGGGVIGDLTGFAASILLRGIGFVQVPTTLLSQVDSAVGGKTAIDMPTGKNLVGSFHQPLLVLSDMDVLRTLPRRELLAGYAEVVKYGLLGDPAFFDWCERAGPALVAGDADAARRAVVASCRAKAAIVARDERETGDRALLNLGHTFGHALEVESGFGGGLLHGEAVAIGTIMAFDLSARLGLCPGQDAVRVRRHFAAVGLPTGLAGVRGSGWTAERLVAHMAKDKKARNGRVTFILVRGIGQAFVARDVEIAAVTALLEDAIAA
ncbi:3-dehydroquinate synthase [Stella sp.]|uniref:3-dehydroquinate synthase n=1 Tax=Stella sp. TaxID=2912054 RepID=UPI0035B0FD2B